MTDDREQGLDDAIRTNSWPGIRAVLEDWPEADARREAIDRAVQATAGWDPRVCDIPAEVWAEVADGAEPPAWWPIGRHVSLGEHDTLEPVDRAPQLASIELTDPGVELEPLAQLRGLRRLEVTGSLDDWSLLRRLASLEAFATHRSPLYEADERTFPRTLQDLTIDGSPIASTAAIAPLAALRELRLDANTALRDLGGLAALHQLARLSIGRCPVADLAPLAGLARLQVLELNSLPVADLAPIAALPQLEVVALVRLPNVRDAAAAPLAKLPRLRSLTIDQTPIADRAPFDALGLARFRYNPSKG